MMHYWKCINIFLDHVLINSVLTNTWNIFKNHCILKMSIQFPAVDQTYTIYYITNFAIKTMSKFHLSYITGFCTTSIFEMDGVLPWAKIKSPSTLEAIFSWFWLQRALLLSKPNHLLLLFHYHSLLEKG